MLGDDAEAARQAQSIRARDDFPPGVADALAALAGHDRKGFEIAVGDVLASFESRDEYLEEIPVADTVMVLQALATRRGLGATLSSVLLPTDAS